MIILTKEDLERFTAARDYIDKSPVNAFSKDNVENWKKTFKGEPDFNVLTLIDAATTGCAAVGVVQNSLKRIEHALFVKQDLAEVVANLRSLQKIMDVLPTGD